MKQIAIKTEYITLGQLLKVADVIDSGGMAKAFLAESDIHVNGTFENRRGRKLYRGDHITIKGFEDIEIV